MSRVLAHEPEQLTDDVAKSAGLLGLTSSAAIEAAGDDDEALADTQSLHQKLMDESIIMTDWMPPLDSDGML